MALSLGKLVGDKKESASRNALNKEELIYLLNKIKDVNFKGGELEILTQVVIKLQEQYTALEDNNG